MEIYKDHPCNIVLQHTKRFFWKLDLGLIFQTLQYLTLCKLLIVFISWNINIINVKLNINVDAHSATFHLSALIFSDRHFCVVGK